MSSAARGLLQIQLETNYSLQEETLKRFVREYRPAAAQDEDIIMVGDEAPPKYMDLLQRVANRKAETILFELDDLFRFETQEKSARSRLIVDDIAGNAAHYSELLSKIVDELMPPASVGLTRTSEVVDVIIHQRLQLNARRMQDQNPDDVVDVAKMFPPELTRRYSLYFKPLTSGIRGSDHITKALAAREVRGADLGKLITVRGIITRVSDVKPQVTVAAYSCDSCGNEVFQEVKNRQFSPLGECPSQECRQNNAKGRLHQLTRASKFVPFQDVRIQELADQVPVGQIPRSLTVSLKGPLVRSMTPGDLVDITGIFLPRPYTGLRALRAGLLTDTFLEAQHIHPHKPQYDDLQLTSQIAAKVDALWSSGNVYERLSKSIAPEIFGHDDIKKALLLLLIGGVTKEIGDGMRIRGDINICMMGDPGVAKSQLLKFISKVAPRAVYTTGRGSSGVGLTAAVMRDPVTDEMILEGGALVLADNGVCCIDEFDKMDDSDRTAIHEVMEQQTISIAKAGISTNLNARTSILAAANPIYGRYNTKVSATENINLPAALLSRFDLLFLILDRPNEASDKNLAEHVTYVHMHSDAPAMDFDPVEPATLREYIGKARTFRPVFVREVAQYASQVYVQMRQREKQDEQENRDGFGHITPRALLGILRLAQAHARLHFRSIVTQEDVDEAIRLNETSKQSLHADSDRAPPVFDRSTLAYRIIREHFDNFDLESMPRSEAESIVLRRGLTQSDLDRFYDLYADGTTNQFYLDAAGTTLYRAST